MDGVLGTFLSVTPLGGGDAALPLAAAVFEYGRWIRPFAGNEHTTQGKP